MTGNRKQLVTRSEFRRSVRLQYQMLFVLENLHRVRQIRELDSPTHRFVRRTGLVSKVHRNPFGSRTTDYAGQNQGGRDEVQIGKRLAITDVMKHECAGAQFQSGMVFFRVQWKGRRATCDDPWDGPTFREQLVMQADRLTPTCVDRHPPFTDIGLVVLPVVDVQATRVESGSLDDPTVEFCCGRPGGDSRCCPVSMSSKTSIVRPARDIASPSRRIGSA